MEIHCLQYRPEPVPNSFYAPDEVSVKQMEDGDICWNSTRTVVICFYDIDQGEGWVGGK